MMMITAKTKSVCVRERRLGEIDEGVKRLGLWSFLRVGPDLSTISILHLQNKAFIQQDVSQNKVLLALRANC